jgi:hypothetical protein
MMPINFTSLASSKTIIAPILHKSFQYNKKKYQIEVEDGWWILTIEGNKASPIEPYMWLDETVLVNCENKKFSFVKGYTYGNQIIFQSFDAAKRNWDIGLTAPLHFNQVETFSPIVAIVWENGQFFYAFINYLDQKIYEIKLAYDNEESLDGLKGVTPELRTLYLFHALERDQIKEMLKQQFEKEEHEKRMQEIPYRLRVTLERAGASLLGYSTSGNRIIIDWQLKDGSFKYNSVINATSWMVEEAGYCLSGGDKRLNVTSLAKTAEEYEDRGVTFLTRH